MEIYPLEEEFIELHTLVMAVRFTNDDIQTISIAI